MKLVVFTVKGKTYGMDITHVVEVIRMREIFSIAGSAPFVEGVISLRDKVFPLINLKKKLGLGSEGPEKSNRIIVMRFDEHLAGVIVDSVDGTTNMKQARIEAPDEMLSSAEYLIGVGKLTDKLVMIMDVSKLLTGEEKSAVKEIHGKIEVRRKAHGA